MKKEPLVTVDNVSFHYRPDSPPDEWAIKGVSLSLYRGETVAVIGPNGSGKSTLAKLINGLLKPLSGHIDVDGLNPASEEDVWAVRERVGIVFQNPDNQIVAPTVRDDVAFGLENLGVPRELMEKRVKEAIARVGLTGMEPIDPSRLSGGQKQRLAIAGIIAMRPELIILDEATAMLDPRGKREVAEVVRDLRAQGMTVLYVTHDLEEVWDADRVVVMAEGTVRMTGTPEAIFQHRDELTALALDLPFAALLKQALIRKGLPLNDRIENERHLVNELWTLWRQT